MVIFCLALLGFEWLIVAIYPSFGSFFVELPEPFKAFLKIAGGIAFGIEEFLAFGYYHPLWLIVSGAFVISLGAGAVAGEIERGTILVLLSRPVPRYHLITSKGLSIVSGLVALMLASVAGTALGIWTIDTGEQIEIQRFLLVAVNGFALFLAVGCYTILFSALFDSGGRAISFAAGLTLIFYLITFLTDLWETVEPLVPFSLFHYYDPGSVVRNGLLWEHMTILLGVAAISFIASLIALQRRDISA